MTAAAGTRRPAAHGTVRQGRPSQEVGGGGGTAIESLGLATTAQYRIASFIFTFCCITFDLSTGSGLIYLFAGFKYCQLC